MTDPLRLHEALQQAGLLIFRVLVKDGREAFQNFGGRLEKFAFVGVALLQPFQNAGSISVQYRIPLSLFTDSLPVGFRAAPLCAVP